MTLNKIDKRLIATLQQGDVSSRIAAYYGAAFSIAEYIKDNSNLTNLTEAKIQAKTIMYQLAELALVSKPLLIKAINNMLMFEAYICMKKDIVSNFDSFESSIGISIYFNKEDIDNINLHMDLYNSAIIDTKAWIADTLDETKN